MALKKMHYSKGVKIIFMITFLVFILAACISNLGGGNNDMKRKTISAQNTNNRPSIDPGIQTRANELGPMGRYRCKA
jgi:hypothetical protein